MVKLTKWLKDCGIVYLAFILSQLFIFWAYGCEPKTTSMLDPGKKVTRGVLTSELEVIMAEHKSRIEDLDRQVAIRNVIFEQSLIIAQGGSVNPLGILTAALAILGIGTTVDDVRLRRERKKQLIYEPVADGPKKT